MGYWGVIALLAGALVLGFAWDAIGHAGRRYAWLFAAIGAFVGAYVASEFLGTASSWGPALDGVFVLPALIGAIILGGLVEWGVRATTPPRSSAVTHG